MVFHSMVAPIPALAETMCPLRFAQIRTGQPGTHSCSIPKVVTDKSLNDQRPTVSLLGSRIGA
jgi:hypothetical protein